MSCKLIINPHAGRGAGKKAGEKAIEAFKANGLDFDHSWTTAPLEATGIARQASGNFEKIIAVGGDGTVNEVGAGVIGSESAFSVIPVGTGNDFAKFIGAPFALKEAVELISNGPTKRIDVMQVNDGYSINGMGVGFDAVVADEGNRVKMLRGATVYIWAMLKAMMKFSAIPMRIESGGRVIEKKVFLAAVCNGRSMGGGFMLAPGAKMDDGKLDVCIIDDVGKFKLTRNIGKAFDGTLDSLKEFETFRADKITIESEEPLPLHVDGEVVSLSLSRIEVSIKPAALNVIGNWDQGR